jgi:hypothetical protein
LGICYAIGYRIRNRHQNNPLYRKWFIKGLSAKLFGGLAFALVYTYYFDYGGDTRAYHRDSLTVLDALFYHPQVYFEVITRKNQYVSAEALDIINQMAFHAPSEYYIANLTSVFSFLGGGSYFSTNLLVALFTFWGVWHFFLLLVEKYPRAEKAMAFTVLFVPSVFFWGSGISKDSFIFCGIGLFLYYVNELFKGKVFNLKYILIITVCVYFMFVVKPYVIISLAPAVVLWRTLHFRDKISNSFIRGSILPIVLGISVLGMVFTLDLLSKYNQRYSMDSFVDTAQSMQGWHYKEGANTSDQHGRGSSYTLGTYDASSWQGMLKVFPAAINVTFFRPYLWEVKNTGMLAQAIESLIFLLFAIMTILKVGIFRIYKYISNDSFVLMCFIFALFFGFAVGFSSYNFGALSRYKIPSVPFFLATFFILRHKYKYRHNHIEKIVSNQNHLKSPNLARR